MQRVNLDGVDLEYTVQGSGEPLVLIHGAILADAFSPAGSAPHRQHLSRDRVPPPRLCGEQSCQRSIHDRAAGR